MLTKTAMRTHERDYVYKGFQIAVTSYGNMYDIDISLDDEIGGVIYCVGGFDSLETCYHVAHAFIDGFLFDFKRVTK